MRREQLQVDTIIKKQIIELNDKGVVDFTVDPRVNFHLDTTKIAFHKERVDAWKAGKKVAPITIDMALTQKCSYACTFCYAGLQQNPSSPVSWEKYEQFLDDCVDIGHAPGEGVKAISLVSDGESTENPDFYKFIQKAYSNGIDIASATNGVKIAHDELPNMLNVLTYLRFNINAAEPEAYAQIMGTSIKNYHKVIDTIKETVRIKKETKSNTTIGLQMVLMPEYADQVIPLALLGRELGVDYTVIKHCSDDEKGRLGVDYDWYKTPIAVELLKTAEAISTKNYSVQAKWSKMMTGRDRKYSKCFGPPLFLQMSGTGIVAPCGSFFHSRYNQYHIGDIKEQNFYDIWNSSKYDQVMEYISSDKFEAKKQCATLCLQDKVNEVLNDLVENNILLDDVHQKKQPDHINFI
ncbi:MAG: radical SAM protein [Lentimicrobiaceae bacterium]|nr:radical SAM protein [Lentimicrobiaceae bacterium]